MQNTKTAVTDSQKLAGYIQLWFSGTTWKAIVDEKQIEVGYSREVPFALVAAELQKGYPLYEIIGSQQEPTQKAKNIEQSIWNNMNKG